MRRKASDSMREAVHVRVSDVTPQRHPVCCADSLGYITAQWSGAVCTLLGVRQRVRPVEPDPPGLDVLCMSNAVFVA